MDAQYYTNLATQRMGSNNLLDRKMFWYYISKASYLRYKFSKPFYVLFDTTMIR